VAALAQKAVINEELTGTLVLQIGEALNSPRSRSFTTTLDDCNHCGCHFSPAMLVHHSHQTNPPNLKTAKRLKESDDG
jgi:hypothetical protein